MSNFTTTTGHFFHYIKSPFLVDHYYDITTSKMAFQLITTSKLTKITTTKVVDHYYENQNVEKNAKRTLKVSVLSDFHILTTYGVSTYGVLAKTKKILTL